MKKSLFVIFVPLFMVFTGCNLVVPMEKYTALETENANLSAQIEQLQSSITALEEQNVTLDEKIAARREMETTDPFDEKILSSLFLRPDLIPVGGEKMRYYTEICRVLGERYVYAYAEDGRDAADMILSYAMQEDGSYSWQLEVYDAGSGWQLAEAQTEPGAITAPVEPPQPQASEPQDTTASQTAPQEPQEPQESQEPQEPQDAPAAPAAPQAEAPGASTPSVNVPVPNEAQQQKFREIASLID